LSEIPKEGDLVLVRVKKILPYGAFCELEEFENQEAFVHISEVASRWIKNIHEFVSVGKKYVARVYRIKSATNQIDLSLKRVSDTEKRRKLDSIKRSRRATKLLEVIASTAEVSEDEEIEYHNALIDKYGDLYFALEEVSEKGLIALKGLKFPKKFSSVLVEIAQKSVRKPKAHIKGMLNFRVYESNGVKLIVNAFSKLKIPKGIEWTVNYVGAPFYQIDLIADDYKVGEKALNNIMGQIEKVVKSCDYHLEFDRVKAEK